MHACDRAGNRLTASPEAVAAYRSGVEGLLQLRAGALGDLAKAVALDPTFALAHAGLAVIGYEFCAPVDLDSRLAAAQLHAGRSSVRERSHVAAVVGHIHGDRRALVRHLGEYPDDALLLSVAVPTIAFAGVTEVPQDAWAIVESCAPAYGDEWFFTSLLGFVRQEQGRFEESMTLSCAALDAMPSAGHAAHARAHVHYETADHAAGLSWLDGWMAGPGSTTDNMAHYAWHAAMHELSDGDLTAVGQRYDAQLSPRHVEGCRALVDAGSLVWRWAITPGATGVPAVHEVRVERELLNQPPTAFTALHAAVMFCADEDVDGLVELSGWAAGHDDPVYREVIAPVARGMGQLAAGSASSSADTLAEVLPHVWRVGGSDAQREIVEETLLVALLRAGRYAEARRLVDGRQDRRHCRRDEWFAQLSEIDPPETLIGTTGSRRTAGPLTTDPSLIENELP